MENDALFTELLLQSWLHHFECLLQLSVSSSEIGALITQYFKRFSSSSNKSAQSHEKGVSVHTSEKVEVNAAGRKAFKYNAPPFLLSPTYLYSERAKTVNSCGPEWRLI